MTAGKLHTLGRRYSPRNLLRSLAIEKWRGTTINTALEACKIGIVIIGPRWLEKDDTGHVRLMGDGDVMREEIATLLRMGKRVVPVLVGGAQLPTEDQLPEELHTLTAHQATSISNSNWATVVRSLIRSIQTALDSEPSPERPHLTES